MKPSLARHLSPALLVCTLAWPSAQATTWDATADFTPLTARNPNGVWSYGYDPGLVSGYQFKAFDLFFTAPTIGWIDSSYSSLGTPSFGKNITASVINGLPPGQLYLHPGPIANGDAAILRFTAPSTGAYSVSAQFFAGDTSETEAWVALNGKFSSPLASVGITSVNPTFSSPSLQMNGGDTLDFIVGNSGSFFSDTTPLALQISSVPEPGSAVLALLGLLLLGARLSTRQR